MLELTLSVVENVASFSTVGERLSNISGHNRSIIEKVQESATVFGEDDLLLCSLDGCGKVVVVGLLELLASLFVVSKEIQSSVFDIRCL